MSALEEQRSSTERPPWAQSGPNCDPLCPLSTLSGGSGESWRVAVAGQRTHRTCTDQQPTRGLAAGDLNHAHDAAWRMVHALAYSLANFQCTLALPQKVAQWSMSTLRERLVKMGAKIIRRGRSLHRGSEVAPAVTNKILVKRLSGELRSDTKDGNRRLSGEPV